MGSRASVRGEEKRTAQPRGRKPQSPKKRKKRAGAATDAPAFRFDDPYWDEVFNSYYDPTLRTCCRI